MPARRFCGRKIPPGNIAAGCRNPLWRGWKNCLRKLSPRTEQPGLFNAGLAWAFLSAWRQFAQAADVPVRDVHPAVEKAARLIRDEDIALKLDELARRAGLSPHRLSRLFKQQTGIALVDFRNRQRMEKFLQLYGTGQRRTMLDAALEAGFGSYPQFHRVFKRMTGHSPRSHQRQVKSQRMTAFKPSSSATACQFHHATLSPPPNYSEMSRARNRLPRVPVQGK